MLSSPGLVFARLCLALSKIYMPASGWVAVRGVWLFGNGSPLHYVVHLEGA
jgi:hypothetical protein